MCINIFINAPLYSLSQSSYYRKVVYLSVFMQFLLFKFFLFHASSFHSRLYLGQNSYEFFRGWTIGRGGADVALVRRLHTRFSSFDRSYCSTNRRPVI